MKSIPQMVVNPLTSYVDQLRYIGEFNLSHLYWQKFLLNACINPLLGWWVYPVFIWICLRWLEKVRMFSQMVVQTWWFSMVESVKKSPTKQIRVHGNECKLMESIYQEP